MNLYLKKNSLALLIVVLPAFLHAQQKESNSAEIQFFNAMPNWANIELRSHEGNENFSLKTGNKAYYKNVKEATYSLHISSNTKEFLQKEYGLAKNEKYTGILFGDVKFSNKLNQSNFNNTLHAAFEGNENYSGNGFLPNLYLFRDQISLKKGYFLVRAFHAGIGASSIKIELQTENNTQIVTSALPYGHPEMGKSLKAGTKKIRVFLKDAPKPLISTSYTFERQKVYVLVVYKAGESLNLKIVEGQSK